MTIDPRELALRALHTFWQAFIAVLAVTWTASGLDVGQLTDLASAKKLLLAVAAAVLAAALSAAKTTVRELLVPQVTGTGAGSVDHDAAALDSGEMTWPASEDPDQPHAGAPPPHPSPAPKG